MGSIPIGGSIFYFPDIRSMLLASVLLRTDSIVAPASARPWIMRQTRIRMDRIRFHDSRSEENGGEGSGFPPRSGRERFRLQSEMQLEGHSSTQAPQSTHLPASMIAMSSQVMAPSGQTSTHAPHATHSDPFTLAAISMTSGTGNRRQSIKGQWVKWIL